MCAIFNHGSFEFVDIHRLEFDIFTGLNKLCSPSLNELVAFSIVFSDFNEEKNERTDQNHKKKPNRHTNDVYCALDDLSLALLMCVYYIFIRFVFIDDDYSTAVDSHITII